MHFFILEDFIFELFRAITIEEDAYIFCEI